MIFTSLPDEIKPFEAKVTRAYSIVGFHVFEPLEDGRILFEGLMQNDFNVGGGIGKIGAAAAISALPKQLKTWFN